MPWITVNSEQPKPTTFEDLGYVQVVLCKDCKYYHKPEYGFTIGDCTYRKSWYQTGETDFCSKGEMNEPLR